MFQLNICFNPNVFDGWDKLIKVYLNIYLIYCD